MPGPPPGPAEPDADDPIGIRFPNTARICNYQLGGKDNFADLREPEQVLGDPQVRGLLDLIRSASARNTMATTEP